MENLELKASDKSPEVFFDGNNGKLLLKGRSIPENSIEFYKPMYDWLDTYSLKPKQETIFEVYLEYFNTSSSKCLLDLFKKLERLHNEGSNVKVHWFFVENDEEMAYAGEDYQAIMQVPFKVIQTKEK